MIIIVCSHVQLSHHLNLAANANLLFKQWSQGDRIDGFCIASGPDHFPKMSGSVSDRFQIILGLFLDYSDHSRTRFGAPQICFSISRYHFSDRFGSFPIGSDLF